MHEISDIKKWHNVDRATFVDKIVPLNQPAILAGLVKEWPMVTAAQQGLAQAVEYLCAFDNHTPAYTIVGQPEIQGRFFYSEDLKGVNFLRTNGAITAILEQLMAMSNNPKPHAVAIQAAQIRETLPGFEAENKNPILDDSIAPTLWLGNKAMVAPHYDVHDNIACVVTGKRQFTLFPPDQIANLYVGPTLNAPGGVPISMVDLKNPDFEQFPNFEIALEAAQQATLEPGDAIFIPTPWWHAVESLDSINVLVNYWWGGLESGLSPNHSLMHSMLTQAKLQPHQRDAWRHFYDYFVFKTSGNPAQHLPNDLNDLITSLTPEQQKHVYQMLREKLS